LLTGNAFSNIWNGAEDVFNAIIKMLRYRFTHMRIICHSIVFLLLYYSTETRPRNRNQILILIGQVIYDFKIRNTSRLVPLDVKGVLHT
jgi:hypothetical protein